MSDSFDAIRKLPPDQSFRKLNTEKAKSPDTLTDEELIAQGARPDDLKKIHQETGNAPIDINTWTNYIQNYIQIDNSVAVQSDDAVSVDQVRLLKDTAKTIDAFFGNDMRAKVLVIKVLTTQNAADIKKWIQESKKLDGEKLQKAYFWHKFYKEWEQWMPTDFNHQAFFVSSISVNGIDYFSNNSYVVNPFKKDPSGVDVLMIQRYTLNDPSLEGVKAQVSNIKKEIFRDMGIDDATLYKRDYIELLNEFVDQLGVFSESSCIYLEYLEETKQKPTDADLNVLMSATAYLEQIKKQLNEQILNYYKHVHPNNANVTSKKCEDKKQIQEAIALSKLITSKIIDLMDNMQAVVGSVKKNVDMYLKISMSINNILQSEARLKGREDSIKNGTGKVIGTHAYPLLPTMEVEVRLRGYSQQLLLGMGTYDQKKITTLLLEWYIAYKAVKDSGKKAEMLARLQEDIIILINMLPAEKWTKDIQEIHALVTDTVSTEKKKLEGKKSEKITIYKKKREEAQVANKEVMLYAQQLKESDVTLEAYYVYFKSIMEKYQISAQNLFDIIYRGDSKGKEVLDALKTDPERAAFKKIIADFQERTSVYKPLLESIALNEELVILKGSIRDFNKALGHDQDLDIPSEAEKASISGIISAREKLTKYIYEYQQLSGPQRKAKEEEIKKAVMSYIEAVNILYAENKMLGTIPWLYQSTYNEVCAPFYLCMDFLFDDPSVKDSDMARSIYMMIMEQYNDGHSDWLRSVIYDSGYVKEISGFKENSVYKVRMIAKISEYNKAENTCTVSIGGEDYKAKLKEDQFGFMRVYITDKKKLPNRYEGLTEFVLSGNTVKEGPAVLYADIMNRMDESESLYYVNMDKATDTEALSLSEYLGKNENITTKRIDRYEASNDKLLIKARRAATNVRVEFFARFSNAGMDGFKDVTLPDLARMNENVEDALRYYRWSGYFKTTDQTNQNYGYEQIKNELVAMQAVYQFNYFLMMAKTAKDEQKRQEYLKKAVNKINEIGKTLGDYIRFAKYDGGRILKYGAPILSGWLYMLDNYVKYIKKQTGYNNKAKEFSYTQFEDFWAVVSDAATGNIDKKETDKLAEAQKKVHDLVFGELVNPVSGTDITKGLEKTRIYTEDRYDHWPKEDIKFMPDKSISNPVDAAADVNGQEVYTELVAYNDVTGDLFKQPGTASRKLSLTPFDKWKTQYVAVAYTYLFFSCKGGLHLGRIPQGDEIADLEATFDYVEELPVPGDKEKYKGIYFNSIVDYTFKNQRELVRNTWKTEKVIDINYINGLHFLLKGTKQTINGEEIEERSGSDTSKEGVIKGQKQGLFNVVPGVKRNDDDCLSNYWEQAVNGMSDISFTKDPDGYTKNMNQLLAVNQKYMHIYYQILRLERLDAKTFFKDPDQQNNELKKLKKEFFESLADNYIMLNTPGSPIYEMDMDQRRALFDKLLSSIPSKERSSLLKEALDYFKNEGLKGSKAEPGTAVYKEAQKAWKMLLCLYKVAKDWDMTVWDAKEKQVVPLPSLSTWMDPQAIDMILAECSVGRKGEKAPGELVKNLQVLFLLDQLGRSGVLPLSDAQKKALDALLKTYPLSIYRQSVNKAMPEYDRAMRAYAHAKERYNETAKKLHAEEARTINDLDKYKGKVISYLKEKCKDKAGDRDLASMSVMELMHLIDINILILLQKELAQGANSKYQELKSLVDMEICRRDMEKTQNALEYDLNYITMHSYYIEGRGDDPGASIAIDAACKVCVSGYVLATADVKNPRMIEKRTQDITYTDQYLDKHLSWETYIIKDSVTLKETVMTKKKTELQVLVELKLSKDQKAVMSDSASAEKIIAAAEKYVEDKGMQNRSATQLDLDNSMRALRTALQGTDNTAVYEAMNGVLVALEKLLYAVTEGDTAELFMHTDYPYGAMVKTYFELQNIIKGAKPAMRQILDLSLTEYTPSASSIILNEKYFKPLIKDTDILKNMDEKQRISFLKWKATLHVKGIQQGRDKLKVLLGKSGSKDAEIKMQYDIVQTELNKLHAVITKLLGIDDAAHDKEVQALISTYVDAKMFSYMFFAKSGYAKSGYMVYCVEGGKNKSSVMEGKFLDLWFTKDNDPEGVKRKKIEKYIVPLLRYDTAKGSTAADERASISFYQEYELMLLEMKKDEQFADMIVPLRWCFYMRYYEMVKDKTEYKEIKDNIVREIDDMLKQQQISGPIKDYVNKYVF